MDRPTLEERVRGIFLTYCNVEAKDLNPRLMRALASYGVALANAFQSHIQVLKSRSQDLQDGEISVYQKAFLVLVGDGTRPVHPGALQLFMNELVGGHGNDSGGQLGDVSRTWDGFQRLFRAVPGFDSPESTAVGKTGDDVIMASIESEYNSPEFHTIHNDHRLERMFNVYQEAKTALLATDETKYKEKYTAARFLRDTLQNMLTYLCRKRYEKALWSELQGNLAMAKMAVKEAHQNCMKEKSEPHMDVDSKESNPYYKKRKHSEEERGLSAEYERDVKKPYTQYKGGDDDRSAEYKEQDNHRGGHSYGRYDDSKRVTQASMNFGVGRGGQYNGGYGTSEHVTHPSTGLGYGRGNQYFGGHNGSGRGTRASTGVGRGRGRGRGEAHHKGRAEERGFGTRDVYRPGMEDREPMHRR